MEKNVKIFYVNCIEPGYALLKGLMKKGLKVDCIISLTPEQAKRYDVCSYKDFRPLAKREGIRMYFPERYDLRGKKDLEFFSGEHPDLLMVFGWNRLIPRQIIGCVRIGGLGAHGSGKKLPEGRGRATVNWAIIEGRNRFYIHLYFLDAEADSGDIIERAEFEINQWDDCRTVHHKIQVVSQRMIMRNLGKILAGTAAGEKQDNSKATYYPKRTPSDGIVDWKKSTAEIYNLVRAVTRPYPGAFSYNGGKKVTIWGCQPFDSTIEYKGSPGEVVEVLEDCGFVVKTGDSQILVRDFECEDEKWPKEGSKFSKKK